MKTNTEIKLLVQTIVELDEAIRLLRKSQSHLVLLYKYHGSPKSWEIPNMLSKTVDLRSILDERLEAKLQSLMSTRKAKKKP